MEAYIDLNIGGLYKPPYSYFFHGEKVSEGLPINDQLYFLGNDKDVLVYAPYDRFVALINKEEYDYLLTHPVSDNKIPKDLLNKKFYGVNRTGANSSKDITFYPTDLTVFLGDACPRLCSFQIQRLVVGSFIINRIFI